jgi:hypothetical protein
MQRIYLEWKHVAAGYKHLYLVRREEPVNQAQISELTWRNSGEVIRGGSLELPIARLNVQTGPLVQSGDRYVSQDEVTGEQPRGIIDITGSTSAEAIWLTMETYASTLSSTYAYETPGLAVDVRDHVANSNAIILSVLNEVGIDVREIIQEWGSFPGAGINATLLGSSQSDRIEASSELRFGVTLFGRDNINDVLVGTKYGDRFYGEKSRFDNGNDTVSYEKTPVRVDVTLNGSANESSRTTVLDEAGIDELVGIEKIVLTPWADKVTVINSVPNGIKEIDAGGTGGDELDLSQLGRGVIYHNGRIDRSDINFKNFDKLKFGSGNDLIMYASTGAEIETGEGADKIWLADNIGITDLSPEDRIGAGGWTMNLHGGLRPGAGIHATLLGSAQSR